MPPGQKSQCPSITECQHFAAPPKAPWWEEQGEGGYREGIDNPLEKYYKWARSTDQYRAIKMSNVVRNRRVYEHMYY